MTPPSPTTPTSDEDFEADVRAMLARRAADVSPTTSPRPGDATLAAVVPRASRRGIAPPRRSLAAAAAAAMLVAGVATYALVRDTSPSVETSAGSDAESDPIIWPLGDQLPRALTEPGDTAAFYLAEVVGVARPTLWPPVVEGDRATVRYRIDDVEGEVALRRQGEQWGVTSVSSDAVQIEAVALADDVESADAVDGVTVDVELGEAVEDGMALRTWSVDSAGTATASELTGLVLVATDDEVVLEPGSGVQTTLLMPSEDPDVGSLVLEAPMGPQPPVAVRVDVLAPDDGDPTTEPTVIGHASVPAGTPAAPDREAETTAPPPGTDHADAPATTVVEAGAPTTVDPLVEAQEWALYAGRGTAIEVAQAYLDDRLPEPERVDGLRLVPERTTTEFDAPLRTNMAVVPWEITPVACRQPCDADVIAERYRGVIRLQEFEGGWAVVAATTDAINVTDVRRDGAAMAVTIERPGDAAIDTMQIAVHDADGQRVGEVAYANLGQPGTYRVEIGDDVPADAALTLRVHHVGGAVFSITELRLWPWRL